LPEEDDLPKAVKEQVQVLVVVWHNEQNHDQCIDQCIDQCKDQCKDQQGIVLPQLRQSQLQWHCGLHQHMPSQWRGSPLCQGHEVLGTQMDHPAEIIANKQTNEQDSCVHSKVFTLMTANH
jgi:hypothetical protein